MIFYMVQTNTLPMSLPQSLTAKQETRPNVVPITAMESGDVLFDKDSVPNQELAEKVYKALEADKNTIFVLRGDKSVRYESVVATAQEFTIANSAFTCDKSVRPVE